MASAGQDVNHLNETYDGRASDIWTMDMLLLISKMARAMLELCMFAEGSEYQEEITVVGPKGKLETKVPGPVRFWPSHLGSPVPILSKAASSQRRPAKRTP